MRQFLPAWTLQHGFYSEMGGFKVVDETTGQKYTFRTAQLYWLAMNGVITLPAISKKDITDRSKANRLAKVLACLQSAQFVVSSIARVVQHLPLTTLEIGTLPFIGCTWLTYFFWWNKVVDLETSTTIYTSALSNDTLRRLVEATCYDKKSGSWYRPAVKEIHSRGWDFYWFEKSTDMKTMRIVRGNGLVPKDLYDMVKCSEAEARVASWYLPSVCEFQATEWDNMNDLVLVLAGWFFYGLHFAAWNNTFPTELELLLYVLSPMASLLAVHEVQQVRGWMLTRSSQVEDIDLPYAWIYSFRYADSRCTFLAPARIGVQRSSLVDYHPLLRDHKAIPNGRGLCRLASRIT